MKLINTAASVLVLTFLCFGCTKGCGTKSVPAPQSAPMRTMYVHSEEGIVVREAPDLLSRPVATVPDGSMIAAGEVTGQWMKVTWQGKTGWTGWNKLSGTASGVTADEPMIIGTWCAENEQPGSGCYSFFENGKMNIECPMCFHGTWSIQGDTVYVELLSPEQGPAGEKLEPMSFSGKMSLQRDGSMKAEFPQGDGSGHNEGNSWYVFKQGGAPDLKQNK